jgi:DNA-binding GntR family transcriptional regulator
MRASDRAYATLLHEIQSGALPPGAVLGEVEQAARLGVSRTPAREAIGRLVADGLVAQQSPRVTAVTDFDAADIRALFEVRRALEESTARLAALRGDPAVFAELAGAFAGVRPGRNAGGERSAFDRVSVLAPPRESEAEALGPEHAGMSAVDAYYALIARFDAALDAAVGNAYFTSALRTIRTHLARARRLARDNRERLAASAAEHRLIAEAIASGDPDLAAHATHVHLHHALTAILASIEDAPGDASGRNS